MCRKSLGVASYLTITLCRTLINFAGQQEYQCFGWGGRILDIIYLIWSHLLVMAIIFLGNKFSSYLC